MATYPRHNAVDIIPGNSYDICKFRHQYFENLVATDFDDIYLNHVKTGDFINELIVLIPKRIERLLELNAPQVVIDSEIATLESLKKIKQQPSVNRHAKMTHLEG